jgi:NADH-ubiquinone oxidoreductase chain 5
MSEEVTGSWRKLCTYAVIYLLIRFRPSFSYWLNVILLLVSGLTMFIAGLGANFEFDLKRIIALSTLRQLGLMIIRTVCTYNQW